MSFEGFDDYVDSGIDWLGEVPTHWTLSRVSYLFRAGKGKHGQKLTQEFLAVNAGDFPVYSGQTQDDGLMGTWDEYEFDFPNEGVLFSTTVGAKAMHLRHLSGKFSLSQNCLILWPTDTRCKVRFFYYHLQPLFAYERGKIPEHMQASFRIEDLYSYPICLPPQVEQETISSFLDVETSKIDGLVSEQRRLIELLKEKRQAVISHAVTKGLNPNAPMKPSGIQWLGDVPQHWRLERGRYLYKERLMPPELDDGVVTCFRDGQVTLRTNRRTDGFTMAVLEVGYQRVLDGDLVIHGMDAFAGAIGVSESTGKCTPEYSVLVPTRDGIDNQYYAKLLRLMALRNYIYVICPSVRERAPRFRFTSFKNVWLPVPPIEEQAAIVDLIKSKSTEFDILAAEAERAIELLQERRTALVSAAVTGKIDVRQLVRKEEEP